MSKPRIRYLNLFTIRYPFTSIISFLHRLSGIFVFLLIPFLLWLLNLAFSSAESFLHIKMLLTSFIVKFILWLVLVALWYHLLAGIRHILMDVGWGESLVMARVSGAITIIVSFIAALFLGIWLW